MKTYEKIEAVILAFVLLPFLLLAAVALAGAAAVGGMAVLLMYLAELAVERIRGNR